MDNIETDYRLRALETPISPHLWAPFAAACFMLFTGITAGCLFALRHHEIPNQQSCSAEITEVTVTTESTAAAQIQTTVITVHTTASVTSTDCRLPESTESDANESEWLLIQTQITEDSVIETEQHKYTFIDQKPALSDETEVQNKDEMKAEIPAEMQKALDTFWEKSNQRMAEDSTLKLRSDWVFLDDTEHLRILKADTQIPYFTAWAELSKSWGSNNTALAIYMISDVLHPQGAAIRKDFADRMQDQLTLASDAVRALGEKITAEDAAALQETYGYMIAPALQDIGKPDLLQIDPDSPCQDAEKLAEFARYFA